MISVIICSADPGRAAKMKEHIEASIGTDFELLVTDNRIAPKGICQVYNEAAALARFDILCFIHEDIFIHTNNWGKYIPELLALPGIGLVGVSGTVYKSAFAAAWPACDPALYRINTIQHFSNQASPVTSIVNPAGRQFDRVAVLDGVFLATTKKVFSTCSFDEKAFTGFHCYDLDLSLNIGQTQQLVVSYDILLEHFSEGKFNQQWFEDSLRLHQKWKNILPRQVIPIDPSQKKRSDFLACRSFLQHALVFSASRKTIVDCYLQLITMYWQYNRLSFTKAVFKKLLKFNQ